jgi:hypothetical protein
MVNEQSHGLFIKAASPANPVTVKNNIFSGAGTIIDQASIKHRRSSATIYRG